tara:strand:+ start:2087 stop:3283 length:1197 start_codon:yes stop_codon:yes gene_type:complete
MSKPTAYTQKEILSGNSTPAYNRANDVSRSDDTQKELAIGLQDLDYAVKYYFDEVIKPTIDDFGSKRQVPVMYGSPERWKNIQEDGYFRDREGKIMAPIIAYKRTAVTKNRALGNKVDANHPQIYYTQEVKYTQKNKYDQFSKLTNRIPVRTFVNTVMADYVDITYEVVVWTDFVEQMNNIVESIMYSEGSFWGEKERFKFRAKIDSFTNTTDALQDSERVVRTNFTITLFGYIVPDAINKHLSEKLSDKTFSTAEMIIETGVDNSSEMFRLAAEGAKENGLTLGPNRTTVQQTIVNTTSVTGDVLIYLGTNKALEANPTNTDTVVFAAATFLTAPSGLPATSKTSFTYFVNGQLVEPTAVTSFADNGNGTCTLVVDVAQLGFTLALTDEIVAIGKFQ